MAEVSGQHSEHYHSHATEAMHTDIQPLESLDPVLASLSQRPSSVQPVDQEWADTVYALSDHSSSSLINESMPFFSALPSSSEEYIESEAAIAPYIHRYHSPACSDHISNHSVYSEYSDSEPSTWPSPDHRNSASYTSGPSFMPSGSLQMANNPSMNFIDEHSLGVRASYPPLGFDLHPLQIQPAGMAQLPGSKPDESDIDVTFQWCLQEPYSNQATPLDGAFNQDHLMPLMKSQHGRPTTDPHSSMSSYKMGGRVRKTSSASTRAVRKHVSHRSERDTSPSAVRRAFICPLAPYGCTSAFASKNEWKRHTRTQHMRMGFWRCDQCPRASRQPNDFNRKDLFVQHVRRMHAPQLPKDDNDEEKRPASRGSNLDLEEQILGAIARRCYLQLRAPPTFCCCVFCNDNFEGPSAWDERVEHIGKHFETFKKHKQSAPDVAEWRVDTELERWLVQEQIIARQPDDWSYWVVQP